MPKWIVRPYGSASGSGLLGREERRRLVDRGVVRAREVGGAAPQLGDHTAERLQDLAGGGTRGDAVTGLEDGELVLPARGQLTGGDAVEVRRALRVGGAPRGEALLPLGLGLAAAVQRLTGVGDDLVGDLEGLLRVEAEHPLRGGDLVVAEGRAVRGLGVLGVRGGPGDDRAGRDERRALGLGLGGQQRAVQALGVEVAAGQLVHALDVPAVGLVTLQGVLGDRGLRVALDRDVVVVPQQHQVAELLVAGQRGRLGRDALLEAAVTGDDPDGVVERGGARGGLRVEETALVPGGHRHAHGVGDALAQRAGRRLDTGGVAVLRVTGRPGAPGAERLQVVQFQAVPGEVELDVQRQAGVARGEYEPVASGPLRVRRVVAHHLLEEGVRGRSEAHRRTRVAVSDLLYGVRGQDADGVHGPLVQFGPLEVCGGRLGAHPESGLLSTVRKPVTGYRTGHCRAYPVARPYFCPFHSAGDLRSSPPV